MPERFKTIGVLGALESEIDLVLGGIGQYAAEDFAGVCWHVGSRAGRRLVVGAAGMGKVNAASATQALIDHFGVDAVLLCGIAGGVSGRVRVGDVVIGKTLCHHDGEDRMMGKSAPHTADYSADPLLCDAAEQGCRLAGVPYVAGRIATGDRFVGDPALKRAIYERCRPDAVEMEGAAVAQVAMRNRVPFLVLRAISDTADKSEAELGGDAFDIGPFTGAAAAVLLATVDALKVLDA